MYELPINLHDFPTDIVRSKLTVTISKPTWARAAMEVANDGCYHNFQCPKMIWVSFVVCGATNTQPMSI